MTFSPLLRLELFLAARGALLKGPVAGPFSRQYYETVLHGLTSDFTSIR
jgi:hypothetical protein